VIIAVTSSCARDIDCAAQLHEQLTRHGVEHHLFVEQVDRSLFESRFGRVRLKPDDAGNGLGRGGSLCRWNIHRQIVPLVGDGDTVVNIDSDCFFVNESMIEALACRPGETKGFTRHDSPIIASETEKFYHCSGMIIAAASDVYIKAWSIGHEELSALCYRLIDQGLHCSEDITASYLYQCRAGGRIVHLDDQFSRFINHEIPRRYDLTDDRASVDVIC